MDERRVPTATESLDSLGERSCEKRAQTLPLSPATASSAAQPPGPGFTKVTHEVLFVDDGPRCDVCGDRISDDDDPESSLTGSGLYVWSHGGQLVYEEPPLCAACSTTIAMSALARWGLEDDEG